MSEASGECPKAKIKKAQDKFSQEKDLDLSKMTEAWSETGEIFKSAIDYMANQAQMMAEIVAKSDKTSKELKFTRAVVFFVCMSVIAIDVASCLLLK
tara:strand:+ start:2536 stop:2826 length:291 start_codon:yes stop_codon:yes gene_type:complete